MLLVHIFHIVSFLSYSFLAFNTYVQLCCEYIFFILFHYYHINITHFFFGFITKNCVFYVVDSKTVVKDRLKKCSGDIFVINSNTMTTFLQTCHWWGIRWQTCNFLILIQRRSCPDDRLCMVGAGYLWLASYTHSSLLSLKPLARIEVFIVVASVPPVDVEDWTPPPHYCQHYKVWTPLLHFVSLKYSIVSYL